MWYLLVIGTIIYCAGDFGFFVGMSKGFDEGVKLAKKIDKDERKKDQKLQEWFMSVAECNKLKKESKDGGAYVNAAKKESCKQVNKKLKELIIMFENNKED